MPNEKLTLEIAAVTTGQRDIDKLSDSMGRVGDTADKAGKQIHSAFERTPALLKQMERGLIGVGESALLITATAKAMAAYTASGASAVSTTDALVNSGRALRFALAPTIFTGASIGVGVLVEETLRLVNARGKLIEQQSLLAATSGNSFSAIERIGSASRLSGTNPSDITAALTRLRENIGSSTVQGALGTVGVASYARSSASPELLADIAKGFSNMEDPAKRARAAVDLFGEDLGGKVLPQLNRRFAEGSQAVTDWSLTLSEADRNGIYVLRRDMVNLKDEVLSLGTGFQAFGAAAEQSLEVAAGRSYKFLQSLRTLSQYQKDNAAAAAAGRHVSDGEVQQIISSSLAGGQASADKSVQFDVAKGLREEARGTLSTLEASRTMVERRLGEQRSIQEKAADAIRQNQNSGPSAGKLSPEQARDYSSQLLGSTQAIGALQSRLDSIDVGRRQQDALRSSQELQFRSSIDPGAGRDLRGEILKSTTFVDKDGNLQKYQLLDGTRRNIETAFSAYTRDLNHKASREQIKSEEELFALRKNYDARIFERHMQFVQQTGQLDIASIAHESTLAGYTRDEKLKSLNIGGIGLTGSSAIRNSLAQIGQRGSIEAAYLLATSTNETEASGRTHRRQVGELDASLDSGTISKADYSDRLKVLNEDFARQGTTINDKFSHDLLTTQQDAVTQTTEIIKRLENEQIDKFKSLSGGFFDAATSGGTARFIESQIHAVGRTVFENASGLAFKQFSSLIPKASDPNSLFGKLAEHTPFEAPLKASATALDTSAAKLSGAADALVGAAGGGAGTGSKILGSGGLFSGSSSNPFIFNNQDRAALGIQGTAPIGPLAPDLIMTGKTNSTGIGLNAKTIGGVTAAAGGAFAAFSDFKTGGVKNDIAGVGAALGGAAGIAALIPGGQIVALGLGIAAAATSVIASILPDPKQVREKAINKVLEQNKYYAPEALNITQSTRGTFADFDTRGNLRNSDFSAVPNVSQPYQFWKGNTPYDAPGRVNSPYGGQVPVVNIHINSIDTQSGADFLDKHGARIADSVASHLQNAHGRLTAAIQYVASN
jgi:hypothetical protein